MSKSVFFSLFSIALAATSCGGRAQPQSDQDHVLGVNGDSVKVLTYNVWALAEFISPLQKERVEAICDELKAQATTADAWDFVLLQEVWDPADRATLKKCGYEVSVDLGKVPAPNGKQSHLGLMILALEKHELTQSTSLDFSTDGDPKKMFSDGEALVIKGAVLARFLVNGKTPLWILNTHLIANYESSGGLSYKKERDQELREIKDFYFSTVKKDGKTNEGVLEPAILGGDLNMSAEAGTPAYDPVIESFGVLFPGFQTSADQTLAQNCTYCPPNQSFKGGALVVKKSEGKIDHLWGSSGLFPRDGKVAMKQKLMIEDQERHLSDHFGWSEVFEFK